jgi:hypothetical protein
MWTELNLISSINTKKNYRDNIHYLRLTIALSTYFEYPNDS